MQLLQLTLNLANDMVYNLRAQYESTEEIQCEKSYVNRTILVYELKMYNLLFNNARSSLSPYRVFLPKNENGGAEKHCAFTHFTCVS